MITGDALVAAAVIGCCLLLGLAGQDEWYWSAAVSVPMLLRRTAPRAFLALVAMISGAHLLVSHSFMFPGDLVALVAVHATAAYAPGRSRHAGLLIGAAGAAVVAAQALHDRQLGAGLPAILILATTLAAWSTGIMQRQQRAAVRDADHRRALAEQDSATRAQLAVHEERTRISQEMHDIIAHSLASIIAQAEGGRVAARADATIAGPVFDRIAGLGREALTDVKRLLAVVDQDDLHRYAKGLSELPGLLSGVTAAGLKVTVVTGGPEQALAPGMDLAVYRIVQESLTNVLKHAPEHRAELRLEWTPSLLTVTVTSPLPPGGGHEPVDGRGLSGIRQRCSMFNGDCTITADRDLTVTTTWPLAAEGAPA
ncbi:histidine kinase [Actinoplanes sp. NBRC 101535]|uniref:sensor histidine kinase n=1 Tax=Actinoplanes sp. NBRC 101535 TaxID=3032196 RepID=UPI0024A3EB55|nr:histidine kinase [Actinoplanes sp. NBRC 101535]GLY05068.1 two-component sensor histidine kinase [Actinoplanes sp. NBRC 101535]